MLNLAYNALCDGTRLEDIELRRNDEVFLDALGTERIPDPTTAGDFCRRFDEGRHPLADAGQPIDDAAERLGAAAEEVFRPRRPSTSTARWWSPPASAKTGWTSPTRAPGAIIRLLVTLAETGEVLRWSIAPGNGPATKGPPRRPTGPSPCAVGAGFRKIVLRGDTAFSQSEQLDGWDAEGVTLLLRLQGHAQPEGNRRQPAENGLEKAPPRPPQLRSADRSAAETQKRQAADRPPPRVRESPAPERGSTPSSNTGRRRARRRIA